MRGNYPKWYVGITADPQKRLFNDYNVDKAGSNWIYQDADDADSARIIEQNLIDVLHTKGDVGGGNNSTKSVYAYKITSSTTE